ncbi:DUF4231 domain-containing protein [Brevibacillus ruminantium]|uniref:DUF4231 domain-containing protein n=1 Tax=Brevibacillus ruminantium TaxID=2950604 RepID=A0ABY4WF11_9BACL|nr:DUF4231 domain-containing protein [Brevibacillus ruminantium]USG65750.1 DUF4231 domain-containing protein [Brevibacillus ruminantium]
MSGFSENTTMSPSEYIKMRLDEQIDWYDNKSTHARKIYKRLQTWEIIFAAVIPLLSGYVSNHWLVPFAIALIGSIIVIIASITRLGGYHENWMQYRATCELLRHEKYLYLTGTTPYEERSFHLLVERVESIISSENINWSQLASSSSNKNKPN